VHQRQDKYGTLGVKSGGENQVPHTAPRHMIYTGSYRAAFIFASPYVLYLETTLVKNTPGGVTLAITGIILTIWVSAREIDSKKLMGGNMSSELIVAVISAVAAVAAAIIAAIISANSTRKTGIIDAQSQQLRDLESRNATRKYEIYLPVLELYSMLLNPHGPATRQWREGHPDVDLDKTLDDFAKWVAIYGSDDVVRTYHDLSEIVNSLLDETVKDEQWSFLPLIYHLYGDFLMAVRRDLGHPNSKIELRHILANGGFRFYESHLWPTSCLPLEKLYAKYRKEYNWRPSWEDPSLLNKNDTSKKAISNHPETLLPDEHKP
jgi:hypothetical protein